MESGEQDGVDSEPRAPLFYLDAESWIIDADDPDDSEHPGDHGEDVEDVVPVVESVECVEFTIKLSDSGHMLLDSETNETTSTVEHTPPKGKPVRRCRFP